MLYMSCVLLLIQYEIQGQRDVRRSAFGTTINRISPLRQPPEPDTISSAPDCIGTSLSPGEHGNMVNELTPFSQNEKRRERGREKERLA